MNRALAGLFVVLAHCPLTAAQLPLDPNAFPALPATVVSASATIDTGALSWPGVGEGVLDAASGLAVFCFQDALVVPEDVHLRVVGPHPLALVSRGDLWLHGRLDGSGFPGGNPSRGEGGPGGGAGGAGASGGNAAVGGDGQGGGTPLGGGGGFGGQGELSDPNTYDEGTPPNNLLSLPEFPSGSGGAGGSGSFSGGTYSPAGGGGGGGAGGLMLQAQGDLDLRGGALEVNGGAGGSGSPTLPGIHGAPPSPGSSGGGGGSGGALLLYAAAYIDDASTQLLANGGARGIHGAAGLGGGGRIAIHAGHVNGASQGLPLARIEALGNPGPVPFLGRRALTTPSSLLNLH